MKLIKNLLRIVGVMICLIFLICILIVINGTCLKTYNNAKDYSKWMQNVEDETLVNEIVLPGSHDAGTYKMVWLGETQQFSIGQQLEMGVRYFDIRVNKIDDKYVIFHSIINGVDFIPILI